MKGWTPERGTDAYLLWRLCQTFLTREKDRWTSIVESGTFRLLRNYVDGPSPFIFEHYPHDARFVVLLNKSPGRMNPLVEIEDADYEPIFGGIVGEWKITRWTE